MNRSVCRVMMGVACLAVLGMTATLAGAQIVEVKEKPPLSGSDFMSLADLGGEGCWSIVIAVWLCF